MARYGSCPLAFALVSNFLAIFTAFSILPFDCGYCGEDVGWSKCQADTNSLNCLQANCGPLSEYRVSGMPWRAN